MLNEYIINDSTVFTNKAKNVVLCGAAALATTAVSYTLYKSGILDNALNVLNNRPRCSRLRQDINKLMVSVAGAAVGAVCALDVAKETEVCMNLFNEVSSYIVNTQDAYKADKYLDELHNVNYIDLQTDDITSVFAYGYIDDNNVRLFSYTYEQKNRSYMRVLDIPAHVFNAYGDRLIDEDKMSDIGRKVADYILCGMLAMDTTPLSKGKTISNVSYFNVVLSEFNTLHEEDIVKEVDTDGSK